MEPRTPVRGFARVLVDGRNHRGHQKPNAETPKAGSHQSGLSLCIFSRESLKC